MSDNINIDEIWSIAYGQGKFNESSEINSSRQIPIKNICSSCYCETYENVCNNCGFVIRNEHEFSNYSFEEPPKTVRTSGAPSNNRLLKMQEWMMWTNDEKNEYKLNKYTKELCDKLHIQENVVGSVCNLVSQVMTAIKNGCDGPKRSRVKDGIIIVCIYYMTKNTAQPYSYMDMAKNIDLNMKYISKADKIIMEMINSGKLKLSNDFVNNLFKTEKPIDYVTKIIEKYEMNVNPQLLNQVSELIKICEDNDILLDHTPLSIGVSCFYYILDLNNIDINIKLFSEIYDLSIVTVTKTFNKLKQYKTSLEKMGITQVI
jgi:transcription initiation factor TFIIIB Brf1 subunit/transcription initiation factor TFIIB